MRFDTAVNFIVSAQVEGHYSNSSKDPGGETKYGISKRSYPLLDIKNLTLEHAIAIYRKDYWEKCACPQLPHGLDLLVFDSAINHGYTDAAILLQRACGLSGTNVDGIIGPKTLKAAWETPGVMIELAALRMSVYASNRLFNVYGMGWSRRLMTVLVTAVEDSVKIDHLPL